MEVEVSALETLRAQLENLPPRTTVTPRRVRRKACAGHHRCARPRAELRGDCGAARWSGSADQAVNGSQLSLESPASECDARPPPTFERGIDHDEQLYPFDESRRGIARDGVWFLRAVRSQIRVIVRWCRVLRAVRSREGDYVGGIWLLRAVRSGEGASRRSCLVAVRPRAGRAFW
jgi:hypothetical protein